MGTNRLICMEKKRYKYKYVQIQSILGQMWKKDVAGCAPAAQQHCLYVYKYIEKHKNTNTK